MLFMYANNTDSRYGVFLQHFYTAKGYNRYYFHISKITSEYYKKWKLLPVFPDSYQIMNKFNL